MNRFESDWLDLFEGVNKGRFTSGKSPMWQNLIADFPGDVDPARFERMLFARNRSRSYGFLKKAQSSPTLKLEMAWLWLTYLMSMGCRWLYESLWGINLNRIVHGNLMGYPVYRIVLERMGLWREYERICDTMGVQSESLGAAKAFYVSNLIMERVGRHSTLRVLEIGAGTGNLATILTKRLPIGQYVIIDLPEMLLYSSMTVRALCPEARIEFGHRSSELTGEGFWFFSTDQVNDIPSTVFDVCVNIDSFQEMTERQVSGYIDLVQRVAANGAIFININRRKRVGDFDNNPLTYPYYANEILNWEVDPFLQQTLYAGRKDPHILRVERVRKS